MKTLRLLFPEWQGYGEDARVAEGARLVCKVFSKGTDFEEVLIREDERLQLEDGILGLSALVRNAAEIHEKVVVTQPDQIFLIGGTCGSELIPVAYLNHHYRSDLAVLWFDAHGDLNTPGSSPSGHFHGMVLRTLLGEGHRDFARFIPTPLGKNQVTLVGVRDLDAPEEEYCLKKGIPIISPEDLKEPRPIAAAIKRSGASNLYIHLDLDFFNPLDFPCVLVPTTGGMRMNDLDPILRNLNEQFNVVGLSVVEYVAENPEQVDKIHNLFENSGITNSFI